MEIAEISYSIEGLYTAPSVTPKQLEILKFLDAVTSQKTEGHWELPPYVLDMIKLLVVRDVVRPKHPMFSNSESQYSVKILSKLPVMVLADLLYRGLDLPLRSFKTHQLGFEKDLKDVGGSVAIFDLYSKVFLHELPGYQLHRGLINRQYWTDFFYNPKTRSLILSNPNIPPEEIDPEGSHIVAHGFSIPVLVMATQWRAVADQLLPGLMPSRAEVVKKFISLYERELKNYIL